MVDSGSTSNYIRKNLHIGDRIKLNKNKSAETPHGVSVIEYKQKIPLLKQCLEFFEFDKLTDFDMLLGVRSLRKMKAKINLFECKLYYTVPKEKENSDSQNSDTQKINFTNDSPKYAEKIEELMTKNEKKYIRIYLSQL